MERPVGSGSRTLDLEVTRVLEAGGLALVAGNWSFTGTAADGTAVTLTGHNADVLRRQADVHGRVEGDARPNVS